MIYCIWYPSGGFGHFVNAVFSLHGDNFVRPRNSLQFSKNGNSHSLDLVVPKYKHELWSNNVEFCTDKNYCILIDNGIDNESTKFKSVVPWSKIIKICYTDYSWPIVARTFIEKALNSNLETELPINDWDTIDSWAQREKYFLFLRDHAFKNAWRPGPDLALLVDELLDYDRLFDKLNSFTKVESFKELWSNWRSANACYLDPVGIAQNVMSWVKQKKSHKLDFVNDIWTQSVIYYYIWITFGIEVPHNDYSEWFTTTDSIVKMLEHHGVSVDSF